MSGQLILALRLTLAVSLSTVAGGAFETFASAVFGFITCVPLPCALPPDADIVPVNCRVVVLVASILGGAILHASICVVDFPLANGLRRWWRQRRWRRRRAWHYLQPIATFPPYSPSAAIAVRDAAEDFQIRHAAEVVSRKRFVRARGVKPVSLATIELCHKTRHSRVHAPAPRSLLSAQLRRLDREDASSIPLNVLRDAFTCALTAADLKRHVEWARVLEPPLRHVGVVVPFPVPHVDEPVREVHFFANVLFWYRWLLAAGSSQAAPVFQDIVCCITYLHLVGGLHPVYAFLERQRVRHGDARQEQCDAPSQAEGRASVRAGAGRGRGRRHRLGLKRWSGGSSQTLRGWRQAAICRGTRGRLLACCAHIVAAEVGLAVGSIFLAFWRLGLASRDWSTAVGW